jgi:uncharacterized membrane protein
VTGLPSAVSATFTHASLAAPGSGTSVLKLSAASGAKAGSYSATVSATSGTTKQQIPLAVTCTSAVVRRSEGGPGPRGNF